MSFIDDQFFVPFSSFQLYSFLALYLSSSLLQFLALIFSSKAREIVCGMNSQFCSDSSVQNYNKSKGGNEARREDWNLILVVNLNERTILSPFTCHITCRGIFVPCMHEHMEECHHVLNEVNG